MKKSQNVDKEKMVELGVSQVGEDGTKYGEFISTYFAWVPLQKQKEIAEKLQQITSKDKK